MDGEILGWVGVWKGRGRVGWFRLGLIDGVGWGVFECVGLGGVG